MKIGITIAPPPPPPNSDTGLWFLEHEWPVRDIVTRLNKGAPQTCKTLDDHWENLTEAREWWWYDMFRNYAPAGWVESFIKKKWLAYTDSQTAWTNFNGSDIRRSYVCGTNKTEGEMKQETLVCKGNPVKVIGAPQIVGGTNWYPIEAVDSTKPLPAWQDIIAKPWLCHTSVILYPDGHTSNFPQLGGNKVPLPVIARGGVLWIAEFDTIGGIRQRVLRKLADGEPIPSPIRGAR